MSGYKQNTKLMVKNSAFMYIQMAIKMVISLYTVRIILKALGAEDYGIYNVVGGFVIMFGFITNTLVSASQRYFAFAIGKGEYKLLNRYYNASIICFIVLSIFLCLILEIVGYWFVNFIMVVPDNRLEAVNWVLQFSIISFVVRIISVPFSAFIVSYEKMNLYALVNVLDSFLILGIAYYLLIAETDKLVLYSICMFLVSFINTMLYFILCKFNYRETSRICLRWEPMLIKELLTYSGWYMFGTLATAVRSQGINILLNLFFNPIVNAARAIAYQINNAANQFVTNFFQAVRPQITKLTAAGDVEKMLSLVINSSIISFLLMCLVTIPLYFEMPFVLHVWLGEIPEHTILFSRLVLITSLIDTLGLPLTTAICSSGNIRNFQITTGSLLIMNLPLSYVLLRLYYYPDVVFYVSILVSFLVQIVRIIIMKNMYYMSVMRYLREVFLPVTAVLSVSTILAYCITKYFESLSFWMHLISILIIIMVVILSSWSLGLNRQQKDVIKSMIKMA